MSTRIYNPIYVKALFDEMSVSYEKMNYITSFGFSSIWRRQFLQHINKNNHKPQIIDLLCGMGETWHDIKKVFPQAQLTGLDFSGEMLKKAHGKNTFLFADKATIIQQDILQNDLQNDYFDIVTCAFGLKTFNKNQLLILAKEVSRILKVGGQFTFIEVSAPKNIILRHLYGFYLGKIIPIIGRVFLLQPAQYQMLWQYVLLFQNARQAASIFESVGLKIQYNSYFYGCATGFSGKKVS